MSVLAPIPKVYRDPTRLYAKGWYCVAESDDVSADKLLALSYLDQQLIAFRDGSGVAQVADAYCPHLGAHLASSDGCIENGEIVCPFHKWRYTTENGKCASIPYSSKVPPAAKLSMYSTIEMNGMVLIWWHPAGGPPEALPYDPIAAHAEHTWLKHSSRTFESQMPFRDLHENTFDTAHIQQLHRSVDMPQIASIERRPFGLEVNYAPNSAAERTQIHYMQFNFSGMSMVTHVALGDGFGFLQHNTATPIDRERTLMHIRVYIMDTGSPNQNEIGSAFADRVNWETDQDMKVLNFKKHLERPLLCIGDGPIMTWRRYAEELLHG